MKLTIDSICLISAIMDKIKIDDQFIDEMLTIGKTAKGKSKEEVDNIKNKIGMKIILKLGTKIHEVRDELVKFIAVYKEIPEEEAEKINVIDIIKELMEDKDFTSFLKQKVMSAQKS